MYMQKRTGLWVSYTSKERRSSQYMCRPYKFLVTTHATSYIAFVSPLAFKRWMRERGLRLQYVGRQQARIIGEFSECYTDLTDRLNKDDKSVRSMTLSNGKYVPCLIEKDSEGRAVVFIHHTGLADTDWSREAAEARLAEYRHYNKIFG